MMKKSYRIALVFGGRSGEHEVSLSSARAFLQAVDTTQFEIVPVGVTLSGRWFTGPNILEQLAERAALGTVPGESLPTDWLGLESVPPIPEPVDIPRPPERPHVLTDVDVVFNLIHGTYGEDGCLQGLFELLDVPYVGSGVLGSAVAMDKLICKPILEAAGLEVVDHQGVTRGELERDRRAVIDRLESSLPYPMFVKPANLGSSVGVRKVGGRDELSAALDTAAVYDRRLIVERAVVGHELECAVLGNDDPRASVAGEIQPAGEFYDYDSKYVLESELLIPAPCVDAELLSRIRRDAVTAFRALDCAGLARVDMFLETATDKLYLNEVNTLPGFTPISMYPKLWQASGLSYNQLVERLIELALERHADAKRNLHRYL
jgi:D-alanine-D-alanine ligase